VVDGGDRVQERQGRAVRTALLGFFAAGFGTNVFQYPEDPLLTAMPFVITSLTTGALLVELINQSPGSRPANPNHPGNHDYPQTNQFTIF
jgi:hypothetical protein